MTRQLAFDFDGAEVTESSEWFDDPIAKYMVHKIARRCFAASALTEAGPVSFPKSFRSMEAARRFCEHDHRIWKRRTRHN